MSPVSRTIPEKWMFTTGDEFTNKDDIVKKPGGWYLKHPNGYEELIHVLRDIGNTAAVIASLTNQADGTYSAPETLSFTVTFDEAVVVDTTEGTPYLLVYTEVSDIHTLPYTSGSGTTDLVFSGDVTGMADGTLVVMEEIILGGGTILDDDAGNWVDNDFPSGYTQPAIVMSTAVIDSVANQADGTYADTDTLTFTVTYDEAVTVVTTGGTPSIEVDTGGASVSIPYSSGTGTVDLVFSGAPTGIADGSLNVDEKITLNGGTLSDASSNPADVNFNDDYAQPSITMTTP